MKQIKHISITILSISIIIGAYLLISSDLSFSQTNDNENFILDEIENSIDPYEMIYQAASKHKVLIYGEIHMMPYPKELLAKSIMKLHLDYGFDYLALEIGKDFQYIVDEYLSTGDELILRKNLWTLFSPWHASEDYLKIYKAVYHVNQLSERKMKIICMDYNPLEYLKEVDILRDRDRHMMNVLDEKVFSVDNDARLLILIGANHSVKNNVWQYMKEIDKEALMYKEDSLGTLLTEIFDENVFSFYIDGIISNLYDEEGFFKTKIAEMYEKYSVRMPPVPFALLLNDRTFDRNINLMTNIPMSDNFDGYVFTGISEELKRIDGDKWNRKDDKD